MRVAVDCRAAPVALRALARADLRQRRNVSMLRTPAALSVCRAAAIFRREDHLLRPRAQALRHAGAVGGLARDQHDRTRRRRPQHPDLGVDGARGRGVRRALLQRRRRGAAGADRATGRSRRARHQDAAHGRHGAARAAAQAEQPDPGDLPDLEGRRGRRAARPAHGGRRLHQEAVLAAPADRAHPGAAAARRAGARARRRAGRAGHRARRR